MSVEACVDDTLSYLGRCRTRHTVRFVTSGRLGETAQNCLACSSAMFKVPAFRTAVSCLSITNGEMRGVHVDHLIADHDYARQ